VSPTLLRRLPKGKKKCILQAHFSHQPWRETNIFIVPHQLERSAQKEPRTKGAATDSSATLKRRRDKGNKTGHRRSRQQGQKRDMQRRHPLLNPLKEKGIKFPHFSSKNSLPSSFPTGVKKKEGNASNKLERCKRKKKKEVYFDVLPGAQEKSPQLRWPEKRKKKAFREPKESIEGKPAVSPPERRGRERKDIFWGPMKGQDP